MSGVNPWRDTREYLPDWSLDRIETTHLGSERLGQGGVMAMKRAGFAAVLGLGVALGNGVALAQSYPGMAADTVLQSVIAEMTLAMQMTCQVGMSLACDQHGAILRNAEMMRLADAACRTGNQQACTYFLQAYEQMNRDYTQFSQIYSGMVVPVSDPNNVLGPTHEERMRAIATFGQQNTADWQRHMAEVQRRHDLYMSTLN